MKHLKELSQHISTLEKENAELKIQLNLEKRKEQEKALSEWQVLGHDLVPREWQSSGRSLLDLAKVRVKDIQLWQDTILTLGETMQGLKKRSVSDVCSEEEEAEEDDVQMHENAKRARVNSEPIWKSPQVQTVVEGEVLHLLSRVNQTRKALFVQLWKLTYSDNPITLTQVIEMGVDCGFKGGIAKGCTEQILRWKYQTDFEASPRPFGTYFPIGIRTGEDMLQLNPLFFKYESK